MKSNEEMYLEALERIKIHAMNNHEVIVKIPCSECRRILKFYIANNTVVDGDGLIACNIPCAVCPDCIDSLCNRVPDPPGLICINKLSLTMARELLQNFKFMRSSLEASKFFVSLFPSNLDG